MDNEQDTEKLIDELAGELKPVKRVLNPLIYISPWIVIALAYLAGVIHFLGVRMDIEEKLAQSEFLFEFGLSSAISLFAAYAAGFLAIPDMREKKWLLTVPTTLFGVFMFWILTKAIADGFTVPGFHWHHCFSDALLMAFVPIATLSLLIRKGATTKPGWMAFMSILAVGGMGWMAMRISCMDDDIGHTMIHHFMPFVLIAVLLGVLARRLYRW